MQSVNSEMRELLLVNRTGRLTSRQYRDLVLAPLMTLLVWMVPLGVALLPFVLRAAVRIHVILPIVLLIYGGTMVFRAIRFARAQVQVATLTSPSNVVSAWTFFRAVKLQDTSGKVLRFGVWLAPRIQLKRKQSYLVYYLNDGGSHILLSIAPADHSEMKDWQPTAEFERRMARRHKPSR